MDDIEEWLSTDLVRLFIFSFFTCTGNFQCIAEFLVLLIAGSSETSPAESLVPFEGNV